MESRDAEIAISGSALIAFLMVALGLFSSQAGIVYAGFLAGFMGCSYAFVEEALTRRASELEAEEVPHPDA